MTGMRTLRGRLIIFLVALLGVVQLSEFILTNTASYNASRAKLEDELAVGEKVFARVLHQNQEHEAQAAGVLAADFAFREALATGDQRTIESALENQAARIGARGLVFVNLTGRVVADTFHPGAAEHAFEYPQLLASARTTLDASSVGTVGSEVLQMIAVPVRAPLTIGWVVVCFPYDAALVHDLKGLTGLEVSIVQEHGGRWTTLATTLTGADAAALGTALGGYRTALSARQLELPDGLNQVRLVVLGEHRGAHVVAVLQRSIAGALARFRYLRNTLLLLSALSLAASVFGSVLIGLGVTRPLERLLRAVYRIREGDYTTAVPVERDDEIGALAQSLEHMRTGIADRERHILKLAYEDSLTCLPNRSRFADELRAALEAAVRGGPRFSIQVMDLDRFKYVNDSLGHGVGDHLLREVSRRLADLVGARGCVARLGGDEFAILATGLDAEQAVELARQVIASLEQPIMYQGQPLDVGTSIGIAHYPQHGTDLETLMRNADIAMYVAKRTRNGHAVYDDGYDTSQQEHLSLLGELRRAVEHNELRLYYQPKVTLANATTRSAEALLRWVHPVRGLVPPGEFIPFAEHTGYIKALTQWVLREVVRQCGQWRRDGLELQVSVNISARDLTNRELPETIAALLREHAVPAEMMCLEITESGFMEDPDHARRVLSRLAELGVRLSIDDYGTGYSSLSYIMQLPVHELKIDRSFVSGMSDQQGLATIVRSTIELGHSLGLKVVAEGVEDDRGFALLRELGCDSAQGYYMSPPLPPDAFRGWLDGRSAGVAPEAASASAPTELRQALVS